VLAIDPEVIAALSVPGSLAALGLGFMHYATKWRLARVKPSHDVESRLARLEVAIDDMAAELGRVTEGQQFVTKLLADRSVESIHGAK